MAKKTFKDSDILNAMIYELDEDSVVYGANGHYGVGAYYDITEISTIVGNKEYNSQDNIDAASGATAVEKYKDEEGSNK